MANILERLFSGEKKLLAKIEKQALQVMALEDQMKALSEEQLRAKTQEFKNRYANGETLDSMLVEAFAVAREAARRTINEFPYKVQIMGAIAMNGGDIAEMRTGEGKTLTSTMCIYLNALAGKGVHVVTVNEYLASRDAEWMGQIYRYLGLSVGVNLRELTKSQKREAYACDITYTTNAELGFDYLRDNMVVSLEERVLRGLSVAVVDEVDSILIDESRTPLIISGGNKQTANLYVQADQFAKHLKPNDYEIDEKTRQIMLSESGVKSAERFFKLKNLYEMEHTQLVHHITQALKANYIMKKEVEYVVQDDEIVIVDSFTGRTMPGRAYSDGLHQAIEAKEGVTIKEETATLATITYQNFFRLYEKLCGMTGTAKTEEEEFLEIYNMRVIEIPTNRPVARIDKPDAVFATPQAKYKALIEEVKRLYAKGQPVLIGTISVEASELVHELLVKAHIPHEVLNAKNHAREADIVARAGRVKAVTVATNMAGRGTDIKLPQEAKDLGGLAVLGSERHESRRIDNQLRGRSGRQGDPGFSQFYVSLQDDLMIRFGSDKIAGTMSSLGDEQIESKMLTKSITSAQKRVEGYNYDIRKQLLDYDDVLRRQREIMYAQRDDILEMDDARDTIKTMMMKVIEAIVEVNTEDLRKKTGIDLEGICRAINVLGLEEENHLKVEDLSGKSFEEVLKTAIDHVQGVYDKKVSGYDGIVDREIHRLEKTIILNFIDRNWTDHIDTMDKLRNGIHLRSYAQNNPLQAYIEEGFELFEEMQARIAKDITYYSLRFQIRAERSAD